MVYLCRSCGVDAELKYLWGGPDDTTVTYYFGAIYVPNPADRFGYDSSVFGSFRVLAGVNGFAVANPHFTFHAEAVVNATYYDPSYGTVGITAFDEVAPGCSRRIGAMFEPPNARYYKPDAWHCPHNA
jgi:hypothetical protein